MAKVAKKRKPRKSSKTKRRSRHKRAYALGPFGKNFKLPGLSTVVKAALLANPVTAVPAAAWIAHNTIKNLDKMPAPLAALLKSAENMTISGVYVCRSPLEGFIQGFAEKSTGQKQQFYHLYQVLVLNGPDNKKLFVRVDKNQRVDVHMYEVFTPPSGDNSWVLLQLPHPVNLVQYFANAENFHNKTVDKSRQPFWRYDAAKANCQLFVLWCVEGNGIKLTNEQRNWIYQKVEMPNYVNVGANVVTTAANAVQQFFGAGKYRSKVGPPSPALVQRRLANRAAGIHHYFTEAAKQRRNF